MSDESFAYDEKGEMVKGIFSRIAQRYDTFNRYSSLGIYKLWLTRLARFAACKPTDKVIDVAGGTGDVTFELCRLCPPAAIELTDFTSQMLDIARGRIDMGASKGVEVTVREADAHALPYEDASFDVLTMAYGLRNFSDRTRAMHEALRVLVDGGRAVILEFATPKNPVWRGIYNVYLHHVVPFVGGCICADRAGFEYLAQSIDEFPPQDIVVQELRSVGFEHVEYHDMTGGIAAVYVAQKAQGSKE